MKNSFWRKEYSWMSEDQWQCFEMLCDLFRGPHHVHGKIYSLGEDGIYINCTNAVNFFGTYDYSNMTRAVVMAHDRCIRFAIEPSGPNMLKLVLSKRHKRRGDISVRHPHLEESISKIRESEKIWSDIK
jgi:hypothetical protein